VEHAGETGRMLAGIATATDSQEEDTRRLRELAEHVAGMAGETADATRNQKAFSSRIVDATDGMRTLAEQVSRSTGEHSRNARQVAGALRELGEGVEAIAEAVRQQMSEVEPVRTALQTIRSLAESNQARADVMSETVAALAPRADSLRAELGRFRFRGAPAAVAPAPPAGDGLALVELAEASVVDDPAAHQR
jgi:methyl-accepting chemotaxis protein